MRLSRAFCSRKALPSAFHLLQSLSSQRLRFGALLLVGLARFGHGQNESQF
jgi:hypothetical protein